MDRCGVGEVSALYNALLASTVKLVVPVAEDAIEA
jgi:hypothetical protein